MRHGTYISIGLDFIINEMRRAAPTSEVTTKFEKQIVLLLHSFLFRLMSAKSIIAFGNLQKIESNHESNVRLVWYLFLAYELMNTDRITYIQFDVITVMSSQISLRSNQILHRTVIRIIKRTSKDKKADESK